MADKIEGEKKQMKIIITPAVQKMNKAIDLINEAQELVDSVIDNELKDYRISGEYRSYGSFGFDTLLGKGNPNDTGLNEIVEKLIKEEI